MESEHLDRLCLFRGYKPPTKDQMRIIVEPFHDTTYIGAVLEHPVGDLFLIEFTERARLNDKGRPNYLIAYSLKEGIISTPKIPFSEESALTLSERLVKIYFENRSTLRSRKAFVYQMEAGFDSPDRAGFRCEDLQWRYFKEKYSGRSFRVAKPDYSGFGVMGRTREMDLVVIRTPEPVELYIAGEHAKEDGFKICYVVDEETDPNIATYTDNLGLLVLCKDETQGHGCFNAQRNTDVSLALQAGLSEFNYDHGQCIRLVSNGVDATVSPLDTRDEQFKYVVSKILNSH